MAEEKKLSVAEVRRTIATSLATAFGFVIGLLWNQVVMGGLKVAGVDTTLQSIDLGGWIGYVITAVIITVVMVVFIVLVSRWGNK
jgi:Flp pilus assembly secretin CpaC